MYSTPKPILDPARLAALAHTGLLDTEPEPVFDRITELAARLLGVPVALVSLVAADRQFFKSCVGLPGLPERETSLDRSFCQLMVADPHPLVVNDAREDPRLRDNPAVREDGVVAYAGIPLVTRDGHVLGSFCAVDTVPRQWSEEEIELLGALAQAVVAAVELRGETHGHERTAARLAEQEAELRLLLDQLPAMVWTTDGALRMLNIRGLPTLQSPAMVQRVEGASLEAALVSDPEARHVIVAAHQRALRGESVRYVAEWEGSEYEAYLEPLRGDDGEVRGVVGVAHDVTSRNLARREEEGAREQLRSMMEHVSDVVALVHPDGRIAYGSPSIERALGHAVEEVTGEYFAQFIHPEDLPATHAVFERLLGEPEAVHRWEVRILTRDGSWRHVEAVARSAVHVPELGGVVFVARDVTERVQVEAELRERDQQLLQAQKMEAVGRLAGGVAHDFNNLLTVMAGHAEFLRGLVSGGDAIAEVEGVQEAVQRAAELTRQLLTFSGQRTSEPTALEISGTVERTAKMLGRLIGEDVALHLELVDPGAIRIDPAQLEQVIVNLVVNARDAMMPAGGDLGIVVREEALTTARRLATGTLLPGRYAVLEVTDTGTGMNDETRAHVFDPFFTTKGNEGTGLGLATVFGIVSQAGGAIGLRTALGRGTTFTLYFPASEEGETAELSEAAAGAAGGTERILLVEDDPAVRRLTARTLRDAGYDVLSAENAAEARRLLEDGSPVDLLVTDVIMPGESGPELFASLGARAADLPVIYVSGYPGRKLEPHGVLDGRRRFLPKPFDRQRLLSEVRLALEGVGAD